MPSVAMWAVFSTNQNIKDETSILTRGAYEAF